MIKPEHYWFGRDKQYPAEFTQQVRDNAAELLRRVNLLLGAAKKQGVAPGIDQMTGTAVAGPWRPASVNERTANSGKTSTHLTGEGIDLQDTKGRPLARWCLRNLALLEELGLWMEDPRWTAGKTQTDPWVHLQSRPPKSGRRVYVPSSAPPQSAPLPEQVVD